MLIRIKTENAFDMYQHLPLEKRDELTEDFREGIVIAYHLQEYVFVRGKDYSILVNEESED